MDKYLKNFLEALKRWATVGAGVGIGAYGLKMVPTFGTNETINKAAPGVIAGIGAFALGTFIDNKYAKDIAIGVGVAAALSIVNNFLSGSANPTVQQIASYVPKLGNTSVNTGSYPPDYFLNIDRAGGPLKGLPARKLGDLPARKLGAATNNAYGLMGSTNRAYGLMGATNSAYGLMGS